ncbi:MAG: alpha/beta hydrolase [Pseudomonadota bacterium]
MATLCGYDYVFRAGAASPVLVMLHGTGDDARSFARLADDLAPAATVLSLQGNVDEHGMARFFRRRAMGVYDMADLAKRTEDMAAFLDEAVALHGLQPSALVGIGYSNGANLLANLSFRRPAALRRLVLMHPLIPYVPQPAGTLAGLRVLVTAGRRDAIAPAATTDALIGHYAAAGACVERLDHDGGHELRPSELAAVGRFLAE